MLNKLVKIEITGKKRSDRLFKECEAFFSGIDAKTNKLANKLNFKYDFIISGIDLISSVEEQLTEAQDRIVTNVKKQIKTAASNLSRGKSNVSILKFIPSKKATSQNVIKYLFDQMTGQDDFFLKLKYFNIFESISEPKIPRCQQLIDITSTQNFHKCQKIILSENKVFFLIEFQPRHYVMQIRTIVNDYILLTSEEVRLGLFEQYQFLAFGHNIVGLFFTEERSTLKVFNIALTLLVSRTFNKYKINLHSLNDHEIVCYTNAYRRNPSVARYLIMDYDLETKYSFGQVETAKRPFYFESSSLIQISHRFIYTYFYNQADGSYYVKILSKLSGEVVSTIRIGNRARLQCVKLDNFSGLLVKDGPALKYYREKQMLFKTENVFFQNFDDIDVTSSNELFHLKRYKKLFIC